MRIRTGRRLRSTSVWRASACGDFGPHGAQSRIFPPSGGVRGRFADAARRHYKSHPFVDCVQAERTRLRDAEAPPQKPSAAKVKGGSMREGM